MLFRAIEVPLFLMMNILFNFYCIKHSSAVDERAAGSSKKRKIERQHEQSFDMKNYRPIFCKGSQKLLFAHYFSYVFLVDFKRFANSQNPIRLASKTKKKSPKAQTFKPPTIIFVRNLLNFFFGFFGSKL